MNITTSYCLRYPHRSVLSLALVVLACLTTIVPTTAHAQGGRCLEDECEKPWTTTSASFSAGWFIAQCTNFGTTVCDIEIDYRWRIGCDGSCELRILKVKYTPDQGSGVGCQCPWTDIWQAAVLALVINHPEAACRPTNGDCVNNVRVWAEGCWQSHTGSGGEPDFIQPCNDYTMCCRAEYRVCKSETGDVTIVRTSVSGTTLACPANCEDICDYFPLTN